MAPDPYGPYGRPCPFPRFLDFLSHHKSANNQGFRSPENQIPNKNEKGKT